MTNLLEIETWNTIKKSKKGEREVNLKTLIKEFSFCIKDEFLVLNVLISTGSREHLSADLLVSETQEKTSNTLVDAFMT